jgi:RecJ-like exonuclease
MPYKDRQRLRDYQREYVMRRRLAWFAENGPCSRCGGSGRLELHHKNRAAKVSHKVWSWRESRRRRELSKCCVLCRECHREETNLERRKHMRHGTESMYNSRRCRCDACRRASTEARRRYRARAA